MSPQPVSGNARAYPVEAHRPVLVQLNPAPSRPSHLTPDAVTSRPPGGGSSGGWLGGLAIAGHALFGFASHIYQAVAAHLQAGTKDRTDAARVQSSQELLSMWIQFGNTVEGVAYVVSHPVQAVEGLGTMASAAEGNPQGAVAAMYAAKATYQSVVVEPLNTGGVAGFEASIAFNAATLVGTGGTVGVVAKAARAADVSAHVVDAAEAVADMGRGARDWVRAAIAPRTVLHAATGDFQPKLAQWVAAAEAYYDEPGGSLARLEFVETKDAAPELNAHIGFVSVPISPLAAIRRGVLPVEALPDDLVTPPGTMDIEEAGIRLHGSFEKAATRAQAQMRAIIDLPNDPDETWSIVPNDDPDDPQRWTFVPLSGSTPGGWVFAVRIPEDRLMTPAETYRQIVSLVRQGRLDNFIVVIRGGLRPQDILGATRVYPDRNTFPASLRNPYLGP